MKSSPRPRSGHSPLRQWLLIAILPASLVYFAAHLFSRLGGIDDPVLVVRDLAQTCDLPIGVGLISNLGYLLWIAAATICLFTACSQVSEPRGRARELLLAGGSLSLVLCLDDMFLLHDRYISPNVLYLFYIIFALLILFRHRDLVMRFGGPIFLLSALLLGSSLLFDKFQEALPIAYADGQIVEEGVKFLGIASWLLFWWLAAEGTAKLKSL
jgi:hypothetical protein